MTNKTCFAYTYADYNFVSENRVREKEKKRIWEQK